MVFADFRIGGIPPSLLYGPNFSAKKELRINQIIKVVFNEFPIVIGMIIVIISKFGVIIVVTMVS